MIRQLSKPELEKYVDEQVKAGHFVSPQAVIEAAVAQMMLDDHQAQLESGDLDAIDKSEDEIDRGESIDWKQVSAELRGKYLRQ